VNLTVRRTEPHELRLAADTTRIALLFPPVDDAEWEKWKAGWDREHLSVSAWDGDRCVGHAGSFEFETLVPGGAWLPTSGVTRVGVLPTHTRQGALSRMIRLLLDTHRDEGKVIASLRASEAPIYGRFGFGLAGEAVSVAVDPMRLRPLRGAAPGSMRLLTKDELLAVTPGVYRRAGHRPGAIARSDFFWSRVLKSTIEGGSAEFVAVHTSPDGVDDGYVLYSITWEEQALADNMGTCTLVDLFGATPEVELALWDYMVHLSLIRTIQAENRPLDDLVRHAATDRRGYQVRRRWDEQWVRLLHVDAALEARSFADGPSVTIAVDDPWYPDNCSTFHIGAAGVRRVDEPADLHAPIAAISAAYFGAMSWRDLLLVGGVTGSTDAADRADVVFATHPTTWSGTFF
jgi:predicted acetyltransferase